LLAIRGRLSLERVPEVAGAAVDLCLSHEQPADAKSPSRLARRLEDLVPLVEMASIGLVLVANPRPWIG
jgi:hypothetical protein